MTLNNFITKEQFIQELETAFQYMPTEEGKRILRKAIISVKKTHAFGQVNGQLAYILEDEDDESVLPIQPITEETGYVDTKTVAKYFGVDPETVREWIKRKILPGIQMAGPRGQYKIPTDAFEFFKTQREARHKVVDSILKDKFGDDSDEFEFVLEDE